MLRAGGIGLLALGFFLLCIGIIRAYPVVYWDDAYVRLAFRDHAFHSPWLPLLQLIIFAVTRVTADLAVLRAILALIASLCLVCVYLFATQAFDSPSTGLIAAVLLAANPMFLALATVPYSEILFMGWLLLGLTFYDRQLRPSERVMGVLALNLACLTRYEGWALIPLLVTETFVVALRQSGWKRAVRRSLGTFVQLGLVPLVWLMAGTVQTYAAEAATNASLGEQAVLGSIHDYFVMLGWQAGPAIIVLAAIGLLFALSSRRGRRPAMRLMPVLALNFPLVVLINPFNLRQPFLTLVVIVIFAASGLERLADSLIGLVQRQARLLQVDRIKAVVAAAITIILGLGTIKAGLGLVAATSRETAFNAPYQVALWLDAHRLTKTRLMVLCDDPHSAARYVLAVYAGIPLSDIRVFPDPSFPTRSTSLALAEGPVTHVIDLCPAGGVVHPEQREIESALDDGSIPARRVQIDSATLWIVAPAEQSISK
jgi:hypothetical protein